jgi:hypothetical protein
MQKIKTEGQMFNTADNTTADYYISAQTHTSDAHNTLNWKLETTLDSETVAKTDKVRPRPTN